MSSYNKSSEEVEVDYIQEETIEEIILQLLDNKLVAEYEKLTTHKRIKRSWSVTSFSTTLISAIITILNPSAISIAGSIAAIATTSGFLNTFTGMTDPLIEKLFQTSGTEFVTFSTQVIQLQHTER